MILRIFTRKKSLLLEEKVMQFPPWYGPGWLTQPARLNLKKKKNSTLLANRDLRISNM